MRVIGRVANQSFSVSSALLVTDRPGGVDVLGAGISAQRQHPAGRIASGNRRRRGAAGVFSSTSRTPSQSPQPREWFAGVDDESILSLLDPFDARGDLTSPPQIRRATFAPSAAPNGVWGGELHVERKQHRCCWTGPAGCRIDPTRPPAAYGPRSATSSARSRC